MQPRSCQQRCFLAAAVLLIGASGAVWARPLPSSRQLQQAHPQPPATATKPAPATPNGLHISTAQYQHNLAYIAEEVLPEGWALNVVAKWDAYGHQISKLAGVAAKMNIPISILTNEEAADALASAKAAGAKATVRRLMPSDGPAMYADIADAQKRGMGIEELLSPLNEADLLRAAREAGKPIPVHIFLFNHYENKKYGYHPKSTAELQAIVDRLDPKLVTIKGIMMHTGGDKDAEAVSMVAKFNQVACPVAKRLATPTKPIALHFASSGDIERLMTNGDDDRIAPPAGLCSGPGITWLARIGSLTYGTDVEDNAMMSNKTGPVLTWWEPVSALKTVTGRDGTPRTLAVVDVAAPARYPAPSWWTGVKAFQADPKPEAVSKDVSPLLAGPQPKSYVLLNGKPVRLAAIPTDGKQLLLDVTGAKPAAAVGQRVCLVCKERPLSFLSKEVGADDYNTALVLAGKAPVVATMFEMPQVTLPGDSSSSSSKVAAGSSAKKP